MNYSINNQEYKPLITKFRRRRCTKRKFMKYSFISLGVTSLLFALFWIYVDNASNFQCKLSYTHPDSDVDLTMTYSSVFDYSKNFVKLENTEYANTVLLEPETTKFITLTPVSRYIHRVNFPRLNYSNKYKYTVNIGPYKTQEFMFQTPVMNKTEWNVLIYGDMGLVGDTTRTYIIDRIKRVGADFFIHLGDIAYNMEESYGLVGDMYLSNMEPASSVIPYMTVAGNHEQYDNFTNYYNRFTMPDRNTSHNLWYSLDKPPVKFININSESFYYSFQVPTIKNMINYINSTLKGVNRSKFPWVIVSAHRPMYCSSNNTDDCTRWRTDKVRIALEDMFYDNNVSIYMSAHEHSYERICPIYNGKCQEDSIGNRTFYYNELRNPIHIVNGGSGNREGNSGFISSPEYWSVVRNKAKSYGVLYANYSYLNWTEYGIQENGAEAVIDWIQIIKN